MDAFTKYDGDKAPMYEFCTYLRSVLENEARCLAHGAGKYGRDNWKEADPEEGIERYQAAALRHMLAMLVGEHTDPESGLPHTAHVRCCMGFLESYREMM